MSAHLTRDRALIGELRIGSVSACAVWATTALITVTVAVLGVFSLLPGHQRPTRLLHMPLTVTSRRRLRSGMTPPRMGAIRRGRTAALALVAAVGALYPLLRRQSVPGARPAKRPPRVCQGMSYWKTPTESLRVRSRSTRQPQRSGRGLRRWARRRAAAPTPTTGSRTCSPRHAQRRLRPAGVPAS